jgi:hypothetical protein
VLPMPEAIARAAVDVAHRHHQLVYSHPSDVAGTIIAMKSGVDVLAHAPDTTEGVDSALLGRVVVRHMAMIPTLKMFATTVTTNPAYLKPIFFCRSAVPRTWRRPVVRHRCWLYDRLQHRG